MIGASAATLTLTAVVMLVKPLKLSHLFMLPVGLAAIMHSIYNAMAVYWELGGNLAYASHIIGFTLGIPFRMSWSPKWARSRSVTKALHALYIAVTLVLRTVFSLSLSPFR